MSERCQHLGCGRRATAWVQHHRKGDIPVCDEHAREFPERQEVLV
jgi:hypothetical protein